MASEVFEVPTAMGGGPNGITTFLELSGTVAPDICS